MTKTAKYGIGAAVLLTIAALAAVAARRGRDKPVEVRVEAVERRDLVASVVASGQIEPRTKVDVSADVTGKIVRLAVKEGDIVKRGQFLLQIDPEQPTASLQRAEAALASARASSSTRPASWFLSTAASSLGSTTCRCTRNSVGAQGHGCAAASCSYATRSFGCSR